MSGVEPLIARPGECSFCESRVMVAQSTLTSARRNGVVGPLSICGECITEAARSIDVIPKTPAAIKALASAARFVAAKSVNDDDVMEVANG